MQLRDLNSKPFCLSPHSLDVGSPEVADSLQIPTKRKKTRSAWFYWCFLLEPVSIQTPLQTRSALQHLCNERIAVELTVDSTSSNRPLRLDGCLYLSSVFFEFVLETFSASCMNGKRFNRGRKCLSIYLLFSPGL